MVRFLTLVFAIFLFGGTANASDTPVKSGHECDLLTTQGAMTMCYGEQAKLADKQLNDIFAKLVQKLKGLKSQAVLQAAELSWIDYRQKECEFEEAGTEGGSVQSMISSLCFASLTRDRIKALASQIDCPEGDLTCADGAPAIWDGEWAHGTELLIAIWKNAATNFYWHGDYRDVKSSQVTDDGKRLSFDWSDGKVALTLTGTRTAIALIQEHNQPDVSLALAR